MQTTFQINVNDLNLKFIELIKKHFKGKNVKITVEESVNQTKTNDILNRFKSSDPIVIDKQLDIRSIIDEASDAKIII